MKQEGVPVVFRHQNDEAITPIFYIGMLLKMILKKQASLMF